MGSLRNPEQRKGLLNASARPRFEKGVCSQSNKPEKPVIRPSAASVSSLVQLLNNEAAMVQACSLINASDTLKSFIKSNYIPNGDQIIQSLAQRQTTNVHLLRCLSIFCSSYHLKNYKVQESVVNGILNTCTLISNELVSRLSMSCLADILMKASGFSQMVLPTLLSLLRTLTSDEYLKSQGGNKLYYTLLRSLYYCFYDQQPEVSVNQLLSLVIGLRRFLFNAGPGLLQAGKEMQYLNRAQTYALQVLQCLYKKHSKTLYPFLGMFVAQKTLLADFYATATLETRLVLVQTLVTFLEATPFGYFQLGPEAELHSLTHQLSAAVLKVLELAFDQESREDLLSASCKLAGLALKLDGNQPELLKAVEQQFFKSQSQNVIKNSAAALVTACGKYGVQLAEAFTPAKAKTLLTRNVFLLNKLSYVKELSKQPSVAAVLLKEAFKDVCAHTESSDYKVVNAAFEVLAALAVHEPEKVGGEVLSRLAAFLDRKAISSILPALQTATQLSELPAPLHKLHELVHSVYLLTVSNSSNALVVSSGVKFLGYAVRHKYVPQDLRVELLELFHTLTQSKNYAVLTSISTGLVHISESSELEDVLGLIHTSVNALAAHTKGAIVVNLMFVIDNLANNYPNMPAELAEDFLQLACRTLSANKTKAGMSACKALKTLISQGYAGGLVKHFVDVLCSFDNYKTKTEVARLLSTVVSAGASHEVFDVLLSQIEAEMSSVVHDPFVIVNQTCYKQELVLALCRLVLLHKQSLKGYVQAHITEVYNWVSMLALDCAEETLAVLSQVSILLLEWIDSDSAIPVSFRVYDGLQEIKSAKLDPARKLAII